jgi:hypothetical protein
MVYVIMIRIVFEFRERERELGGIPRERKG